MLSSKMPYAVKKFNYTKHAPKKLHCLDLDLSILNINEIIFEASFTRSSPYSNDQEFIPRVLIMNVIHLALVC